MRNAPVLVDSGPLYALFDRDDAFNPPVKTWFAANRRPLITNAAVTTEVTYLLGRWCGIDHQLLFLEFLQQPGWLVENLVPDIPRIQELMNRYRNLPADFTDASLVALAERLRCTEVATTDRRDFSVYRPTHIERLANPIPLA
ncbi:MAG: PIN domain-containing protein [Candidatus Competibacteraceae bacterium]